MSKIYFDNNSIITCYNMPKYFTSWSMQISEMAHRLFFLFNWKARLLFLRSLHCCAFFRIPLPFQSKCEKMRNRWKTNLIWIFSWWKKVSKAVCKCNWHSVRSYLFFNVWQFRTHCAMTFSHHKIIWLFRVISDFFSSFYSAVSITIKKHL